LFIKKTYNYVFEIFGFFFFNNQYHKICSTCENNSVKIAFMKYYPMRKLRLLFLPWIHKIFSEIFLTTLGGKKNISSITKIAKFLFKFYKYIKVQFVEELKFYSWHVFLKNFRYIFCCSLMVNVFMRFSCRISLCIDSYPENFIFVHCNALKTIFG
jgi:hypothetical protein